MPCRDFILHSFEEIQQNKGCALPLHSRSPQQGHPGAATGRHKGQPWHSSATGLLAQYRQTLLGWPRQAPGSPAWLRSPSPALPPPLGPRAGSRLPWVHGCPSVACAVLAVLKGERCAVALGTALLSLGHRGSPVRAMHCPPVPQQMVTASMQMAGCYQGCQGSKGPGSARSARSPVDAGRYL